MRIAVLADVHGNVLALDAVLSDLERRGGADILVNLGDCVSGPLWPRLAAERLMQLDAVAVRGNHDRQVATLDAAELGASDRYASEDITSEQRDWLGGLPLTRIVAPGILACHATPFRDDVYLLEAIRHGRLVRDDPRRIEERLGASTGTRLVLCGHSHRADLVRLPSGVLVLNPGSVGNPAYEDPCDPHVSESGSPFARYALLNWAAGEQDPGPSRIEFAAVPYGFETAARRAEENGRAGWAHALRTGFASPQADTGSSAAAPTA